MNRTCLTTSRWLRRGACTVAILALTLVSRVDAQDGFDELMGLSLEDLMGVEVSLASRSDQPLIEAAAAVHILSAEDIRRSGATSIAELLRLIPGVQVARIDANKWAVTARGFNGRFANKLLVQVDGRTVYSPAFSGVYWEELDLVLADVDRIEVIRGPGATLWGANAVNGIINIVTQSAAQTQGVLIDAGLGTQERTLSLRYGGQFGLDRHYRVYGKLRHQGASVDTSGRDARDSWSILHGGGRLDWRHTRMGDFQLQAEAMLGDLTNQVWLPQPASPPFVRQRDDITSFGGHALGRWQYESDGGIAWTGQAFYNVQDREEYIEQHVQTVDLDIQGHQQFGAHGLVWGGGLRSTWESYSRPLALSVEDRSADLTYSLFLQDDMALSGDVHFILGTKLEHNEFSGLEVQPTARLRWSPNKRFSWWGGVSRAARTPSGGEGTVRVILPGTSLPASFLPPGVNAGFAALSGNPDLDAEIVHAAETGFRTIAVPWLLLDVSAFVHDYRDLRSLHQANAYTDSMQSTPVLILPIVFGNRVSGTSHGVEAAADIRLGPAARLTAHYSYLDIDLDTSVDSSAEREEGNSPNHQIYVKLRHDPSHRVTLDAGLRHVGELPALDVDAYTELDARIGYRATPDLELYATVHNALSDQHQEYTPISLNSDPARIERAVAIGLTWRR